MPKTKPLFKQELLLDAFITTLKETTGVSVVGISYQVSSTDNEIDVVLEIATPEGRWTVPIELMQEAYPRDVRNAVWVLDGFRARTDRPTQIVPMVVAERLSDGARKELKIRNIGYYDASGSLYLRHDRWFIHIDRPHASAREQRPLPLFTGSREKVVHALLQTKGEWFTGVQLAELSETSVYSVSGVLQELERREWVVDSEGRGRDKRRKLIRPGALLDAWAKEWTKAKEKRTRWYLFSSNPKQLMTRLTEEMRQACAQTDWAFTGAIAANIQSPLLTSVDVAEIAVSPVSPDDFVKELALTPADKGYNVVLIERSGAGMLFRQPYEGAWLASPFIQYLDLLDGRGRNAELAAQLRQDILEI